MKNVLLVGAGNLGKRHLQSLRASFFDLHIVVVDPSDKSREAAADAYGAVESGEGEKQLEFASSLDEVILKPDVAIISTPATGRLQLLRKSIELGASYVVLEKVAFNSERDIRDAVALVESAKAKVWVNCPRRLNPIYQKLKTELADDALESFRVTGANYGLACNFIHFADLLAFLSKDADYSLELSGINSVQQSKRNSYIEFAGKIEGQLSNGVCFELDCEINEGSPRVRVEFDTARRRLIVDETGGKLTVLDRAGKELSAEPFLQPYQSQLTGPVVDQLLQSGTCGLTSFDESMRLHLPFIASAYALYAEKFEPNSDKMVPIT